jgi:hypothetical protein
MKLYLLAESAYERSGNIKIMAFKDKKTRDNLFFLPLDLEQRLRFDDFIPYDSDRIFCVSAKLYSTKYCLEGNFKPKIALVRAFLSRDRIMQYMKEVWCRMNFYNYTGPRLKDITIKEIILND